MAEKSSSSASSSSGLILSAVGIMLLLAALDQTIVATALPRIVADLGGLDHLSWVVTAYLLTSTVVAPMYGKLGDLYGRKLMMQIAVVLFLLGSVLAGFAGSMLWLILSRAIQGLGGGGLFVLALTVVGDVVPPRERGKVQGIFGAIFGLSSIVGPLIGGYLVDQLSWHWIFFVNVPVGVFALVIFAMAFEGTGKRVSHTIDYAGAVLLALFLSSLVLFTSLAGTSQEIGSPFMVGLAIVGVLSLGGFVLVELRAKEPVLSMELFTHNTFTVMIGIGFVIGMAMFGAMTFLPLYLQTVKGVSATSSGLQLIPMMLGMLVGSMGAGQIMSRTGHYKFLPTIGTLVMVGALLYLTRLSPETGNGEFFMTIFVLGLGMGPIMSVGTTAIQNAVPLEIMGVATAGYSMFRQIGGSVGVALFGALFSSSLAEMLPEDHMSIQSLSARTIAELPEEFRDVVLFGITESLHPIFFVAAMMSLAAFFISWFLKEKPLVDRTGASRTP